MIRLAIGRALLWFIVPAAEERWGHGKAMDYIVEGPLLRFPIDPDVFPDYQSDRARRLLHERPVGLHAVANSVRDWLGSLADQHVVGSWGGAGADTEQGIERGMPRSAPIEAEHELVQVVLEVGPPQSVVNAQAPALEI